MNAWPFRIYAVLTSVSTAFACASGPRQLEAAGTYEAQQRACVDRNPDRKSIDACRDKVKAAWSDAGVDAKAGAP